MKERHCVCDNEISAREFWTCIIAVTGVISAAVVFTWNFMAEAQELELKQRELSTIAEGISEQVKMNTAQIEMNTAALTALAGNVKDLTGQIQILQDNVVLLVCLQEPSHSVCEE
ncbi:MAG: hypothetical protein OXC91_05935 [Rhodobacteraceae bacterium]|nr:hypothetical protein [Paracoccaceae bacterium]